MKRANYIGAPQFFNLNAACRVVNDAIGQCYLVGSSLERRDFRDVDVRCILADEDFDRFFSGPAANTNDARWSLICSSIAAWLSQQSGGLPIDFQIQRQTQANEAFPGRRSALGILFAHYPGELPSIIAPETLP